MLSEEVARYERLTGEDVCDYDHYCHSCPHDYVTEDEQGLYYHHCRLKEISII